MLCACVGVGESVRACEHAVSRACNVELCESARCRRCKWKEGWAASVRAAVCSDRASYS